MADQKSAYSEAAHYYAGIDVVESEIEMASYAKSKKREERHGEQWKKHHVNINEICDAFAPDGDGGRHGVKFIFEGSRYQVIADLASGYLRIMDKDARSYVTLDGVPSKKNEETHFKILPREEM